MQRSGFKGMRQLPITVSTFFFLLLAIGINDAGFAQTGPSAREIAAYDGLFRAAHLGDTEEIHRLASMGADVNARDRRGRTPLHVAAFASQLAALRALAGVGADMNALEGQAYDVVTIAAVADDPELLSLAIELGNDPGLITSPYDGTALIAAAHLGHVEVVRRLISAGAPLDHINNLHWTAIMEAVVLGDGGANHQAVLSALLEAGGDPTLGDRDGITPLRHAQVRGFSEMVKILQASD